VACESVLSHDHLTIIFHHSPQMSCDLLVLFEAPCVGEVEVTRSSGNLQNRGIKCDFSYDGIVDGTVVVNAVDASDGGGRDISITLTAMVLGGASEKRFRVPMGTYPEDTDFEKTAMLGLVEAKQNLSLFPVPKPDEQQRKCRMVRALQEQFNPVPVTIATVQMPEDTGRQHRFLLVTREGRSAHGLNQEFGPFLIRASWDYTPPFRASVEISARVPWVGKVVLASAEGDLMHGLTLDIGYAPYVTGNGTVKLTRRNGKMVVVIKLKAVFLGKNWEHDWDIPFRVPF